MSCLGGGLGGKAGASGCDGGSEQRPVCEAMRERRKPHAGREIVMGLRPEHMTPGSGPAVLKVTVGVVEMLGDRMDVTVSSQRHARLVCRVDARLDLKEGRNVELQIDMNRVHFFEPTGAGRSVSLPNGPS